MTFTAAQVRAARALLDWSQSGLAVRARVATSTVADFERGARVLIENNLLAIQRAFEDADIRFLYDGVVTMDGLVGAWHDSQSGDPLHIFLGMTEEEYAKWLERK